MIDHWTGLPYRIAHSTKAMRLLRSVGLPLGNVQDATVVAGSPRSGTTWLAELLHRALRRPMLDEPLHLKWPDVKQAGITEWRPYMDSRAIAPETSDYLSQVLAGRVACNRQFLSSDVPGQLYEFLIGKPRVVKFVRANRMLHWMAGQYDVEGLVLILRHPCAVVASQVDYKHEGWKRTRLPSEKELQTGFGGRIPDWAFDRFYDVLSSVETTAGRLAAVWCLDTYFPLHETEAFPGIVTTYERLLLHEQEELDRILQLLGRPNTNASAALDQPSHSAAPDLNTENTHQQLAKWRDKLSTKQIGEVLGIVEGFGLDFYSEALEPNYARI